MVKTSLGRETRQGTVLHPSICQPINHPLFSFYCLTASRRMAEQRITDFSILSDTTCLKAEFECTVQLDPAVLYRLFPACMSRTVSCEYVDEPQDTCSFTCILCIHVFPSLRIGLQVQQRTVNRWVKRVHLVAIWSEMPSTSPSLISNIGTVGTILTATT